ncbi:MAG: ABC transporter permease [Planctomycetaceae bacterium]|nr:ABC transporter permease [Planctomycetaceae bacterium]
MSLWKIAWRSIEHRSLASILTALSMALGVALVVAVLVIHGVISQTFQRSTQGYSLLIGPKGSKLELVFSTSFYISVPESQIPYQLYEDIYSGKLYASQIDKAIPIAISEPHEGVPVIATYPNYFTDLKYDGKTDYSFREGGNFTHTDDFGAVIGSAAAKKLKLKVGDRFYPHIGSTALAKSEDRPEFTVRGILKTTSTPNDQAIFVNLEGFYDLVDKSWRLVDIAIRGAKPERKLSAILVVTSEQERKLELTGQLREGAGGSGARKLEDFVQLPDIDERQFGRTDIDVTPGVVSLVNLIASNPNYQIQAVYPTLEIRNFFDQIIGNIQLVLVILSCLVIVVAGIGMMVSIYNTMNERRQEIAIMRALGAKRRTVMSIIMLESLLLSFVGGLAGVVIGHGMIGVLSPWIAESVRVPVSALQFQSVELWLIPGLTLLASIAGYLPAVIAYRTDVAQSLNP